MSIESAAPPERALALAGSLVKGRYRVNAVSSVGRDVVVYMAEELRYGRPIVLKVLRDEVASDPEFLAAAREQASTLAISARVHRGVPRVYECGLTDTGELFIALERTRGATVREVLDARGALDPPTALRIASEVGEALETLHHDGILHGQLGPDAVLLVKDDDGIEHVTLVGAELTAAYRTTFGRRRREASAPSYLAPEQVEGGETTDATDQYALGILLRELLTAGAPEQPTAGEPAPPSLPPEIVRIITTALEARPERRFPDISVMVNDIWAAQTALPQPAPRTRSLEGRTSSHRRRRSRRPSVTVRIAAAVATAGIIAAVVWFVLSGALVSRFRATVTPPGVIVAPAAPDAPTAPPDPRPVTNVTTTEGLGHPSAAPRAVPLVERPERAVAPVVDRTPPRPVESRPPAARPAPREPAVTDAGDGSAIIDWLVNRRR